MYTHLIGRIIYTRVHPGKGTADRGNVVTHMTYVQVGDSGEGVEYEISIRSEKWNFHDHPAPPALVGDVVGVRCTILYYYNRLGI